MRFPEKPIRIVTSNGGGVGFLARLIAQGAASTLGQPIMVDNRDTDTVVELVARSPADGYTLLVFPQTLWIGPLMQDATYDPVSDFAPITLAATSPLVVVVHPSLPVSSIQEWIALAKARPGQLNYVSGLNGSSAQLGGALLTHGAGVSVNCIPYESGGSVALNDLLAGKVQLMTPSAGTAMPHVKSGRLRALAVTSAVPSELAPGLPTVAASGLPDYEVVQTIGIFAPAKTPAAIIHRLNQEFVQLLKTPTAKEQLLKAGLEAVGSTPEELAAKIKSEMTRWSRVIKDVGIHSV